MKAFIERSTRHCTRCAKALYRGWIRRFANRRCSRHCSAASDIVLQYVHTAFTCSGFPDLQTGPQPQVNAPTPSDFLQLRWPYSSADHWSYVPLQTQANPLLQISFYAQQIHVLPYFPCQRLCQKVLEREKGEVIRGRILHIQAKFTLQLGLYGRSYLDKGSILREVIPG